MIIWLALVSLAMGLIVLPVRRTPVLAVPLSAAALFGVGVLAATMAGSAPVFIVGRELGLLPAERLTLAFWSLVLGLLLLGSYGAPFEPLSYPVTLGALGMLAAASMLRNLTLAALVLQIGVVLAVLAIPSRQLESAETAIRTLVPLLAAGALLLASSWAIESHALRPGDVSLARLGGTTLILGFGIALAAGPFCFWLVPVFRHGSIPAIVLLGGVLPSIVLLRMESMLQSSTWGRAQALSPGLLLAGGLLTCVIGGVGAISQRSLRPALAFAAIADLGVVLASLGMERGPSALLHLAHRGLGMALVCMATAVLEGCLGGSDIRELRGAVKYAPIAVVGLIVGGASLAGLPPMAGFSSRLPLYRALALERPSWMAALVLSSVGPGWAFLRIASAALSPVNVPGARRESPWSATWILLLGTLVVALGIMPGLVGLLPTDWLEILGGTGLGVGR